MYTQRDYDTSVDISRGDSARWTGRHMRASIILDTHRRGG